MNNITSKNQNSCEYCTPDESSCCIFIDPLTKDYFYHHTTGIWDDHADEFYYEQIYINYCPWCGRKLDTSEYAEWEDISNITFAPTIRCSKCKTTFPIFATDDGKCFYPSYCPNCKTNMKIPY